ncbi:thioredoxin family protein [Flammeovirga agarivorans]|uniref:Thioredoxin family protein n=1 Tax=Flammeovirga agarivorans TaxID=2726742 RepID=A0A7X8SPF5_9BACT|nr:thioredoxin family protein [Flammeovirga agarivorans]NLR93975.1 thioredoxin family protein [Flammeovirga agarivorans]
MKKLILSFIILGALISCTPSEKKQNSEKQAATETVKRQGVQIEQKAIDFELKGIDDQMHQLSALAGDKGAIVIFTCNHCPYAVAYEDRIIALDKKYKDAGYPVIAINPNDPTVQPEDSFDKMKVRAEEKGFTFPYLFDEEQKVYPAYGATKTPHVFLLNKENGSLVVKYIGAIDDNYKDAAAVKRHYVEEAIESLNNNKVIVDTETKAVGCSIKVSKG